jgi:hypothetical protein
MRWPINDPAQLSCLRHGGLKRLGAELSYSRRCDVSRGLDLEKGEDFDHCRRQTARRPWWIGPAPIVLRIGIGRVR